MPRPLLLVVTACSFTSLAFPAVVAAQNVAVQQPIVGAFGVSTTVVAPDSGGAFVGRSARGANSSNRYGFSPIGSNVGREYSTGTMTTHVFIHDFTEMEERLLAGQAGPRPAALTGHAAAAFAHLASRSPAPPRREAAEFFTEPDPEIPPRPSEQDYLEKGRAALASGKVEVAKIYLRIAVSQGSPEAAAELTRANSARRLAKTDGRR